MEQGGDVPALAAAVILTRLRHCRNRIICGGGEREGGCVQPAIDSRQCFHGSSLFGLRRLKVLEITPNGICLSGREAVATANLLAVTNKRAK
jgi:hypothetical protein